jgi:uncharacterized protein involved in exopolysaccharide biosynthesis
VNPIRSVWLAMAAAVAVAATAAGDADAPTVLQADFVLVLEIVQGSSEALPPHRRR